MRKIIYEDWRTARGIRGVRRTRREEKNGQTAVKTRPGSMNRSAVHFHLGKSTRGVGLDRFLRLRCGRLMVIKRQILSEPIVGWYFLGFAACWSSLVYYVLRGQHTLNFFLRWPVGGGEPAFHRNNWEKQRARTWRTFSRWSTKGFIPSSAAFENILFIFPIPSVYRSIRLLNRFLRAICAYFQVFLAKYILCQIFR